ncbi:hypothetical protein ACN28C_01920 [Plantactinospora sp. WMMC1484]|uniref:hypothetical protein n=1 Tax=Plantactinospora sp. WMMC1484 TaxID=3404122 RepID=UPI003BF49C80
MHEYDEDAARSLLRPLDVEPDRPSTLEIDVLLRAGRRRVRNRRLVAGGGLAGATAVVLVAVPVTLAAVRDGGFAVPAPDTGRIARPGVPASAAGTPGAPTSAAGTPGTPTSGDPNPPPAPTRCVPQRLPVPEGATESQVLDGDPTGRYLVGVARDLRSARTWTLQWDRGALTVLDPPTTDPPRLVVNSRGTVAGDGIAVRDGTATRMSWVYRDGRFVDLADPDGSARGVVDINERGDILGDLHTLTYQGRPAGAKASSPSSGGGAPTGGGTVVGGSGPVVWPADAAGRPIRLETPEGTYSGYATGIDDDGTVVGGVHPAGSESTPRMTVWSPDGTPRTLAPPDGYGGTSATASIRGGWVLGWSAPPPGTEEKAVATRWNLRTGEAAPLTGLPWAAAVNRHGWTAGFVRDATGIETPAVLAGARPLALPLPAGAVPGREGPAAVTISDDGRVVGGHVSTAPDDAAIAAVRWTCD